MRRKTLFVVAAMAIFVPVATHSLLGDEYESLEDWYQTRIVKDRESPDHQLVAGVFSDGGRSQLWQVSIDNFAVSPETGAPLGHMRDETGHDEHNGLIFAVSRTGVAGLAWLVVYLPLGWVALKSIRASAGNVVPMMICGGPIAVYLLWSDLLSGPFWVVWLACLAFCAMPSPAGEIKAPRNRSWSVKHVPIERHVLAGNHWLGKAGHRVVSSRIS
jgi:hypothetical protein